MTRVMTWTFLPRRAMEVGLLLPPPEPFLDPPPSQARACEQGCLLQGWDGLSRAGVGGLACPGCPHLCAAAHGSQGGGWGSLCSNLGSSRRH